MAYVSVLARPGDVPREAFGTYAAQYAVSSCCPLRSAADCMPSRLQAGIPCKKMGTSTVSLSVT